MYLVQYKQGLIIGSVSSPNALAPLGDQGRISPYASNINKISSRKMIRIKVQYQFVDYQLIQFQILRTNIT